MYRFLPFIFLIFCASLFGLFWIAVEVDPTNRPLHYFALFSLLFFLAVFCGLGTLIYFARTRLYKKFEPNWYFKTSFTMSFFVALFLGLSSFLVMLELINTFNFALVMAVVILFALYVYLGKSKN